MRVANGIPLECSLLLPAGIVTCVQTLKDITATSGGPLFLQHNHAPGLGVLPPGAGTVRVFTMDSAVLGLAPLSGDNGTVRVFRHDCALEDANWIPRLFA